MKHLVEFFLVIAFFSLFACTEKVDLEVEKVKIKTVLDTYHQAVNNENMELLSQIFAPDDDLVFIHAVEDSNSGWMSVNKGWKSIEKTFENWFGFSDKINFEYKDELIKIHPSGTSAWVSCIQHGKQIYQDKLSSFEGCRTTFGLEKRNGNWIIVQAHFSFLPVQ